MLHNTVNTHDADSIVDTMVRLLSLASLQSANQILEATDAELKFCISLFSSTIAASWKPLSIQGDAFQARFPAIGAATFSFIALPNFSTFSMKF